MTGAELRCSDCGAGAANVAPDFNCGPPDGGTAFGELATFWRCMNGHRQVFRWVNPGNRSSGALIFNPGLEHERSRSLCLSRCSNRALGVHEADCGCGPQCRHCESTESELAKEELLREFCAARCRERASGIHVVGCDHGRFATWHGAEKQSGGDK